MLITKETDYALRILRTLSAGGCFTTAEIAEREEVPKKFAYKIIKKLEKAEMVTILLGARGGCSLECDLKQVTLLELVNAVEKRAKFTACMEPGYQCEWRAKNNCPCAVHLQLRKVQAAIDAELRSKSLFWVLNGGETSMATSSDIQDGTEESERRVLFSETKVDKNYPN